MNKTTIYLSKDTPQLKSLDLDIYFPETELHPVYIPQLVPSLLGKSFCTHSEHIINYIGHLIAEGVINNADVVIHLISQDYEGEWNTKEVMYDSDGYLTDSWELGFFEWEFE